MAEGGAGPEMSGASGSGSGSGSGSTSDLPTHDSPTMLSTLHTLMLSSSPISAPLNHPYAPAPRYGSWKGKSREGIPAVSADEQRRLLEQLKSGIEAAKGVLGRAVNEEGRSKLARAMKDVTTHQSALLPLLPAITSSSSRPPSFRTPPKPMELLTAISQRLGIETYLEESQFGLLKTTLAIAGKRFVLDVELEADSSALGDDTPLPTPAPTPHPAGAAATSDAEAGEARGKVRLAKLLVNHVTRDGGTASSSSIAAAIREGLEAYLSLWAEGDDSAALEGGEERMDEIIKRLWTDMSDLAALDTLTDEGGRDWFAELEDKVAMVTRLSQSGQLFRGESSVLPNFSLLKDAGSGRFRLRPSGEEENISNPFHSESRSGWVLEYVADKMPGMVVRRNWISSDVPAGVGFDTGVHVEQYLCSSSDTPNRFPYTAEFSHSPSTKQTGGLEQRWSVVHPGPAGYLFGRVGWSEDDETAVKLIMALRRQATLNGMLSCVLDPSKLRFDNILTRADDVDEDDDVDFDMLSNAPIALPITLSITTDKMRAMMPLPHAADSSSTLAITFTPSDDVAAGVHVGWSVIPEPDSEARDRIEAAVEAGRSSSLDPIEAIRQIEQALR